MTSITSFKRIPVRKLLSFLFLTVLLSSLLSVGISAESESYVDWVISSDGMTMSDGNKIYTYYPLPSSIESRSWQTEIYEYYDYVAYAGDDMCTIYAPAPDSEFIWIEGYSGDYEPFERFYATESGKAALDIFADGTADSYEFWAYDYSGSDFSTSITRLDDDFLSLLKESDGETVTVNVSDLEEAVRYDLFFYHETHTLSRDAALLFRLDNDRYYFVFLDALDNSYFDSYGNFSYRSGSVTLTALSNDAAASFSAAHETRSYAIDVNYTYESGGLGLGIPLALFWILYIFLGFLLPVPLVVLGFVLSGIKALGKPKYWRIPAICAIVWMALALVLMIILI